MTFNSRAGRDGHLGKQERLVSGEHDRDRDGEYGQGGDGQHDEQDDALTGALDWLLFLRLTARGVHREALSILLLLLIFAADAVNIVRLVLLLWLLFDRIWSEWRLCDNKVAQ